MARSKKKDEKSPGGPRRRRTITDARVALLEVMSSTRHSEHTSKLPHILLNHPVRPRRLGQSGPAFLRNLCSLSKPLDAPKGRLGFSCLAQQALELRLVHDSDEPAELLFNFGRLGLGIGGKPRTRRVFRLPGHCAQAQNKRPIRYLT